MPRGVAKKFKKQTNKKHQVWTCPQIDKSSAGLIRKEKKHKLSVSVDITTDPTDIKRIIRGASLVVQWLRIHLPMQGT